MPAPPVPLAPPAPPTPPGDLARLVDYTKSLDCIHCGLCLNTCPTYRLTGRESASPRGRVHLMRALGEGRLEPDGDYLDEVDGCLLCRRCESVCPAGVRFGELMEHTRAAVEPLRPAAPRRSLLRRLGFRWLLPHPRLLEAAAMGSRLLQRTGLLGAASRLLGPGAPRPADLPEIPARRARRRLPATTPATPRAATAAPPREVILLDGCVMPVLLGRVNRATAAGLAALGVTCHAPPAATCCGSLHAHNGDREGARALARSLVEAYEGSLPVVVNSAGCGAHLKELAHLFEPDDPWQARAARLAARVVDWSEYAAPLLAPQATPAMPGGAAARVATLAPRAADPTRWTWDAPCHLCHGQGVRSEPLALLDALATAAGARRVPLHDEEACCGSAGIHSLLHPEDSNALLEEKLDNLEATGAGVLVTANPGCMLQWRTGIRRRGLAVEVLHLAELLAAVLDVTPDA